MTTSLQLVLKEYGSPSDVITAVLEGKVSHPSTSSPTSSHTVKTTATPVEMLVMSHSVNCDNDEFDLTSGNFRF